jgi:hypothetical protein
MWVRSRSSITISVGRIILLSVIGKRIVEVANATFVGRPVDDVVVLPDPRMLAGQPIAKGVAVPGWAPPYGLLPIDAELSGLEMVTM